MADQRARLESLRTELKLWEKRFPHVTREDIKQDAVIAAKYKEYYRLRDALSVPVKDERCSQGSHNPSKKRKAGEDIPPRQHHNTSTPTKQRRLALSRVGSPDSGKENNDSTMRRAFVDPTPQKDGRVLGLFDSILENPPHTPSRRPGDGQNITRTALGNHDGNCPFATPRAKTSTTSPSLLTAVNVTPMTAHRHSRTPPSSTKRFMLDAFLTPAKRRKLGQSPSPSSLNIAPGSITPAFLSRATRSFGIASESDASNLRPSPADNSEARNPVGRKRATLSRSLSTMIADIRKAEEEKLDEEMELMREMEEGSSSGWQPRKRSADLRAEESHSLGRDVSGSLSGDDEMKNQNGDPTAPTKVWKKKGQKRQTKRVILRPTTKKPPMKPRIMVNIEVDSGEEDSDVRQSYPAKIPDNNLQPKGTLDEDYGHEVEDADFASLDLEHSLTKRNGVVPNPVTGKKSENQNILQKTVKKISATAHANFRRLKIRSSKGAKAAVAGRGRFGRGRR